MAKKRTTARTIKKKKKKWYKVVAPPEFKNLTLGETPASDISEVKGRIFKISLMNLTNDLKKQNIVISFKTLDNSSQSEIKTESIKYEINKVHIKRLVRKGKGKIDDSFVIETKDKVKVRIKPLLLTRNKTQHNVMTAIRWGAREFIQKEADEKKFSELLMSVVQTDLQRRLKKALKKIYPISISEIRILQKL